MTRRLAGLLLLTALATGCASGNAFRHGQEATRISDWDAAVTYFTKPLDLAYLLQQIPILISAGQGVVCQGTEERRAYQPNAIPKVGNQVLFARTQRSM